MPEADRYEARLVDGLCTACGTSAAVEGQAKCEACAGRLAAEEQTTRDRRLAAGLCPTCGKHPPEEGRSSCRACLDRFAEYTRRRAGARKAR